jgi:hypothetical protein
VTIVIIGSFLLGATLGRFFKVPILVPACAAILAAVVVRYVYFGHGLPHLVLEYVMLITGLQIGYASASILGKWLGVRARTARPHPQRLSSG